MELSAKYSPLEVEEKWYSYWLKNKFFHSEPDNREPYTVVIPPPNVTGAAHGTHAQQYDTGRARPPCPHAGQERLLGAWYRSCVHRHRGQGGGQAEGAGHRQVLPDPRGVHGARLGMEGEARWHHPRAAQEARGLLRLGPYPLYDGSGSQ